MNEKINALRKESSIEDFREEGKMLDISQSAALLRLILTVSFLVCQDWVAEGKLEIGKQISNQTFATVH